MLSLDNVRVVYGNSSQSALESIHLNADQSFTILGPSGAGKTSLLKVLMGLIPGSGNIRCNNVDLTKNLLETRRLFSYMPQDNALPSDLTVSEYLQELIAMDAAESLWTEFSQLDNILALVHLEHDAKKRLKWLSGGMKRRAVMAGALVRASAWLLLDEPTLGLDPDEQAYIRALVNDIARQRNVILATHDVEDATALPDRVIVLVKGRISDDTTLAYLSQRARGHLLRVPESTFAEVSHEHPFFIPDPKHQAIKYFSAKRIDDDDSRFVEPTVYESFLWLIREST